MLSFFWSPRRAASLSDVLGIFYAQGPVASVIASAPHAGIGLVEAHGLAFIIGMLLWRAEPVRAWHLTAAAVHILLGSANLVFWQVFVAGDMLVVGYVTTLLHGLFTVLQLLAATTAGKTLVRLVRQLAGQSWFPAHRGGWPARIR